MNNLFRSAALQAAFDKNGFVQIPFLSAAQSGELLSSYQALSKEHNAIGLPFTTTSHSNDPLLISRANTQIANVFAPAMDQVLQDYTLLFGNFLVKHPGPDSVTPPHQDTTFVDETNFSSISVWVSLQDTDRHNGCMRFISGSHRFKYILRPTHSYAWPFEGVRTELEALLEDYPSRQGEAFIFHHALIHASYPNLSTSPRIAAVMAAYPTAAQLLMLYMAEGSGTAVRKYAMTSEAYMHFTKGEPPAMGQLLETQHFDFSPVTSRQLRAMVSPSRSLAQRFRERLAIFRGH